MHVRENISLKPFNSFGIDVKASHFASFQSMEELEELLAISHAESKPPFILGGGSNILLTGDLDQWVLKNEMKGIEKLKEDDDFVYLKAGAGENWHGFVMECVKNNWGGVEKLIADSWECRGESYAEYRCLWSGNKGRVRGTGGISQD